MSFPEKYVAAPAVVEIGDETIQVEISERKPNPGMDTHRSEVPLGRDLHAEAFRISLRANTPFRLDCRTWGNMIGVPDEQVLPASDVSIPPPVANSDTLTYDPIDSSISVMTSVEMLVHLQKTDCLPNGPAPYQVK
ncbi:hypothetical protein KJ781_02765 [Patescibacteria group bacterium]|nr:hypothetical protein [Patescibacteria group bacterium]MBU1448606.1 hypothetical protein [Patescibacteria group bacterium]MBU2613471.1 hypothetical protein [Patescibacteria group bacterium]